MSPPTEFLPELLVIVPCGIAKIWNK